MGLILYVTANKELAFGYRFMKYRAKCTHIHMCDTLHLLKSPAIRGKGDNRPTKP